MNKLKKSVSLLLTLLLLLSVAAAAPVSAVNDDNSAYDTSGVNAAITDHDGTETDALTGAADRDNPIANAQCDSVSGSSFKSKSKNVTAANMTGRNLLSDPVPEEENNAKCTITVPESYDSVNECYVFSEMQVDYDSDNPVTVTFKSVKPGDSYVFDKWVVYHYDVEAGEKTGEAISEDELADLFGDCFNINSQNAAIQNLTNGDYLFEPSYTNTCGQGGPEEIDPNLILERWSSSTGYVYAVTGVTDKSKAKNVRIPASYDGLPVEVIAANAFIDCNKLMSVTIPNSVTDIRNYAFQNCVNLREAAIPDSVKTIGGSAFDGCSNLGSVTFGDSVESIGGSAFADCSLIDVTFPDSLKTIGAGAFYRCRNIGNIEIPDSVESIGANAFKYSNISRLKLGDGLETINSSVFYNSGVMYLSINGNTIINPDDLNVSDEVDDSPSNGWGAITNGPFGLTRSVTHLTVRGTEVAARAFYNLKSLSEVTFEDDVTTIGDYAFAGCGVRGVVGLRNLTIPDSVKTLGACAFYGCKRLEQIDFGGVEEIGVAAFGNTGFSFLTIPDTVKTIDRAAFGGCSELLSLTIGSGLTTLSNDAFSSCKQLRYLTVPGDENFNYNNLPKKTVTDLTVTGESVDSSKFNAWPFTELIIADTVETVASKAFENCERLRDVTIGDNVETLPDDVFDGCKNFSWLRVNGNSPFDYDNLPKEKVYELVVRGQSIKSRAFDNFPVLLYADIEDTVETIGSYSFSDCPNLLEIEIPDSVTTINEGAFQNCIALESAIIGDEVVSIGASAFSNCRSLPNIILPDSIRTIGSAAFQNCISLNGIAIPDHVETVSSNAFNTCTSLTTVLLGDEVANVGASAFRNCTSLRSVSFPNSLRNIGDNAYNNCSKLKNISIPNGVNGIGDTVFASCTDLETAFIWGRTTAVGSDAFAECPVLTIYAYDSSPADTYALNADIPFFPIVNTSLGNMYEDEPLNETQTAEDKDSGFGLYIDVFNNLELLGVQLKTDEGTNDMRFVAVLNEGIVAEATRTHDIDDYGFVVAKTSKNSTYSLGEDTISRITLGADRTMTLSCRKTSNRVSGDYGIYNETNTKYKYITLGIKNVDSNPNQGIAVRFYVKTHSGRIYYANYNVDFTGCAASYSLLFEGENSTMFREDLDAMAVLRRRGN